MQHESTLVTVLEVNNQLQGESRQLPDREHERPDRNTLSVIMAIVLICDFFIVFIKQFFQMMKILLICIAVIVVYSVYLAVIRCSEIMPQQRLYLIDATHQVPVVLFMVFIVVKILTF